jgi:hypothetical protein
MRNLHWTKSDITYARNLFEAGLGGITSALKERTNGAAVPLVSSVVWVSTAAGAIVGVWSATRRKCTRSRYGLAMGGLVGSAFGFGCGAVWESGGLAGAAARSAIHKVGTVRDARWLEENPVAYG